MGIYGVGFNVTDGDTTIHGGVRIHINDVNSVPNPQSTIPEHYFLADPFPNPFNSTTTIRFGLPVAGEVDLVVRDLSGRSVAVLAGGRYEAGYHEVIWDAGAVPAGVYLVELRTDGGKISKKVTLIK